MDIFTILGFMAVALAIFTIGIPYIPQSVLYKTIFGRKPQAVGDIAMMQTYLGMMGLFGLLSFVVLFVLAIEELIVNPIVSIIMAIYQGGHPTYMKSFLILDISIVVLALIGILLAFMWRKAKTSIPITDIGEINKKIGEYLRKIREKEEGEMLKSKPKDKLAKPHKIVKQDITKEEFLANLSKVCQPISKESSESDSKKSQT